MRRLVVASAILATLLTMPLSLAAATPTTHPATAPTDADRATEALSYLLAAQRGRRLDRRVAGRDRRLRNRGRGRGLRSRNSPRLRRRRRRAELPGHGIRRGGGRRREDGQDGPGGRRRGRRSDELRRPRPACPARCALPRPYGRIRRRVDLLAGVRDHGGGGVWRLGAGGGLGRAGGAAGSRRQLELRHWRPWPRAGATRTRRP